MAWFLPLQQISRQLLEQSHTNKLDQFSWQKASEKIFTYINQRSCYKKRHLRFTKGVEFLEQRQKFIELPQSANPKNKTYQVFGLHVLVPFLSHLRPSSRNLNFKSSSFSPNTQYVFYFVLVVASHTEISASSTLRGSIHFGCFTPFYVLELQGIER